MESSGGKEQAVAEIHLEAYLQLSRNFERPLVVHSTLKGLEVLD